MKSLKVAALQINANENINDNLKNGITACRKAKEMGADIALFPEMFSIGYNLNNTKDKLLEMAITKNDPFILEFKALSKKLNMAIAISYLEKKKNKLYNSVILFDRFGTEKYNYSKVHTCDFGDEFVLSKGKDFYVCDLDIDGELIKVGSMICYDREFPESARILMLKGAEIILVPNACPMEINRISQLRGRAYENMVGIITVNYPITKVDCNGHSNAFDGVVYKEGIKGSRDTLIFEADENEGIFIIDFNMEDIRKYRKEEVHGNCYRQPKRYKLLLSKKIKEPFIR